MVDKTIFVIGLWHLGLVTSIGLAELGHKVIGYDPHADKINKLQQSISPIFEPQLEKFLKKNIRQKRLSFTDNLSKVKAADFIYITYDTPLNDTDEVDTSILFSICEELGLLIKSNVIIIIASQIPVGTTEQLQKIIKKNAKNKRFTLAYIPENLRLGHAFERFFKPAMIVIGTQKKETFDTIAQLYENISSPKIWTNIKTAEFVKHAINAYLATSISFANEMGNLSDFVGADFLKASEILKLDERIGTFARISPGLGFAGGTLARDVKILQSIGKHNNYKTVFIDGITSINNLQKKWVTKKIMEIFNSNLENKKIGILGITYTPQTSTLRRSLAIEIMSDLFNKKAIISAYDPKADKDELDKYSQFYFTKSIDELANNLDAVVLMTGWREFKEINFKKMKKSMHKPIFLDPNNFLSENHLEEMGFQYYGFGRGKI